MLLLNDQERYSVYVSAKIVIYFDCTIFFEGFFIGEYVLTYYIKKILLMLGLFAPSRDEGREKRVRIRSQVRSLFFINLYKRCVLSYIPPPDCVLVPLI